ncbi:MAG: hypothetical protein SNJ59_07640 [Aggregatilineales bacterium]
MSTAPLFVEIFPIKRDAVPALTAFHIRGSALNKGAARDSGPLLASVLAELLPGFWLWLAGRIVTDTPPNPVNLLMALDEARRALSEALQPVEQLEEDYGWKPTAETLAQFVARGPAAVLEAEIRAALAETTFAIKSMRIERDYRIRGWSVGGAPALALSVASRLVFEPDLQTYAAALPHVNDLIGLRVADRTSTLQGEVVKVLGPLDEHRERLLGLTSRPEMQALLRQAPADHWVVRIQTSSGDFDYVIDALELIVRPSDAERFAMSFPQIERALQLTPTARAQMVKVVSDRLKAHGLIDNAYSTQNAPERFTKVTLETSLVFGRSRSRTYDTARLPYDFEKHGPYQALPGGSSLLRVSVLNALGDLVDDFIEALQRHAERAFSLTLTTVRERKMRVSSQANLESAVRVLQKETADLMLIFLPESAAEDEHDNVSDTFTRAQTIGRAKPCLIIHESTLHQPEALNLLLMGAIARAGAIPYLLETPLPYADRVVGLSFTRIGRREGDRLIGISHQYDAVGRLLGAVVAEETAAEGDGIPDALLERLLPRQYLREKRVVLHLEGRLQRDFLRSLGGWEAELEATFYPVEISQHALPRLYALSGGKLETAPSGAAFLLSDTEAILSTSDNGSSSLPPLHVVTEPTLPIEQALHSLLIFRLFHYGALSLPALPVTLHHHDLLATAVLRGIFPVNTIYDHPFWL